uniref:Fe2OG dioxygenase domain-containing protein n=1 Tax=Picea sitchensis TaxID=3332 RepID=A9P180_PICSI|nr:unknown [Picea sitchensis]
MATARVQAVSLSGLQSIPSQFVRPVYERPTLETFHEFEIPVIDLSSLEVDELREKTLTEIGRASQEWGIFQVVNHGIPEALGERLQAAGREFFDLPQEEKEAYANLEGVTDDRFEGYGTKLKCTSDGRQGWSDFYFHTLWPPSLTDFNRWPKHPSFYREVTEEYGRRVLGVVDKLLAAFSIDLGLEKSTVKDALGGENLEMELKINFYPPCPQPEMALGVLPHTDLCALTVLKPNDVPGLQIFKNNEWVTAKYVPNTLIIHIGDQLQTLSNGRYKSVLHRTLVSKDKVRMSRPVFCNPPLDLVVGPLKQLIDKNNPPLFDAMTLREFKQRKKAKASKLSSSAGRN